MSELMVRLANRGYGLGRMWRYIRAMKQYQDQSDLGIFRLAVWTLKRNGYGVSNKSISYHFKANVDPEDYGSSRVVQLEALRDLFNL